LISTSPGREPPLSAEPPGVYDNRRRVMCSVKYALPVAVLVCAAATLVRGAEPRAERGFQPLFNGTDLTGWHLRHADGRSGWTVKDGVLMNRPPSTDLVSEI